MAKKRKAKSQQPTQKAFNEHLENYYNKQMHKQLQALLVAAGGGGCRGEGWGGVVGRGGPRPGGPRSDVSERVALSRWGWSNVRLA